MRKTGTPIYTRISIYHSLLRMPRTKFLALVFIIYTSVNMFFACLYYGIGVEHLSGTDGALSETDKFLEAFFFSAQSLTTVGYGRVAPVGLLTNSLSSLESLVGILMFAVVTGIFYGRFSRPRAYIMFSDNFLIAPYKGGRAVMFRLATYKNNHLTDAEAQLTVALHVVEGDTRVTRFFPVKLEISKVNSLALSWTLVHPLNEESPMYAFSEQDFIDNRMELIVNIKAFDDHFSNTVQQRTSYTYGEMVYGAKFKPMYERSEQSGYTLLELDKINAHEAIKLPDPYEVPELAPGFVPAKV
jgi:inward rectifier potassium channel